MNAKIKMEAKNLIRITIASVIYGIGISCFLDPNRLATVWNARGSAQKLSESISDWRIFGFIFSWRII